MGWMHPFYAPLRAALGNPDLQAEQRQVLLVNMDRVRALPSMASGRWVLVDAASARLWMYEGRRIAGTMKVVVGKPESQTPAMAGFLRYAIVNPYWNLPDDLMPSRITDKVLANGPGYVSSSGYQVLSSWDEDAAVLDPAKVDWRAVAAGQQAVRVRQLPGPGNFMGAVKFMFPNAQGIYLHDTPERDLLAKDARYFSNGCVRLEAASKLGQWLLGKPLPRSKTPERRVELPVPVPIFITYLTAVPDGAAIRFRPDTYGRDRVRTQVAVRRPLK
jgi:murein L,D-transpeptidase YcbB/YkuD